MENGIVMKTKEGSPQGENLSPTGRLTETETLEKATGLLQEAVYYIIP